ncbi:S-layer homology domain-containing protein [Clostridium aminobutyricum]|uniref:S-layer homology domain-containing protein n=1 Tax=Clostridium aminobutyricum TaxID=33953 RepID=A0A939DAL1_CLOAM|nr:S-layer homology domain-containing protein [Clostridium aminobutyricum]MBN7774082.1 S-layer homology domain-containing protein [Clostridium aminobutyricum]
MKGRKVISIIAVLVMTLSSFSVAFAADYGDWDAGTVYPSDVMNTSLLAPVKFLMDKKVITGDSDGLFHPDKSITRAEFATMMAKATNNTADLASMEKLTYFKDLDGYTWAKGYINACAKAALINGKGDQKFEPGSNVTYAEVITIIIRSKNSSAVTTGTWPDNYIQYAQMNMNSMIGDRNITDWNAPASKGDVAMMLYRSMPKN